MVAVKLEQQPHLKAISTVEKKQGHLLIIGGAEEKRGECKILREFVRYAGGTEAQIVVMTVATGLPGEVGADYRRLFEDLGAKDVQIIDTGRREDGSDSRALEAIEQATGVFFTGGDQARITDLLKDTQIDELLHKKYAQGIVIAGTSAGAAMMSDQMIVEGESETHPRIDMVEIEPGMDFLPGVIIDQHFSQRGRLGRLLSALIQQSASLGFGIDENTAIAFSDGEIEVIGDGTVTVVDLSDMTHSNVKKSLHDEPLAVCGAKLHLLPHGYRFNLDKKEPSW